MDPEQNTVYQRLVKVLDWAALQTEHHSRASVTKSMLNDLDLDAEDLVEFCQMYDELAGDTVSGGQIFMTGLLLGFSVKKQQPRGGRKK